MPPDRTVPSAESQPGFPSQATRTVVSFLLFLHLFALAVTVTSNVSPSRLESNLRGTPMVRPYLQLLSMDLPYTFHLTYAEEADVDHSIEAELKLADGSTRTVTLPPKEGLQPGQFRHYSRLAANMAGGVGNRNVESFLPQAVASRLVAEYGAKGGTLRCRRLLLRSMADYDSVNPADRDPYAASLYRTPYEARILVSGGRVQLLKIEESTRDTAPPAASGPSTTAPPPSKQ